MARRWRSGDSVFFFFFNFSHEKKMYKCINFDHSKYFFIKHENARLLERYLPRKWGTTGKKSQVSESLYRPYAREKGIASARGVHPSGQTEGR